MADKIPLAILKDAINYQYGTQAKLARKLKISDSQLSTGIKVQSPQFMMRLRKAGLKLDNVYNDLKKDDKQLLVKIQELEHKNEALEKLIGEKDKVINHQNNLLERYDKLLNRK